MITVTFILCNPGPTYATYVNRGGQRGFCPQTEIEKLLRNDHLWLLQRAVTGAGWILRRRIDRRGHSIGGRGNDAHARVGSYVNLR
jgi:hypothetical protein